MSRPSQTESTYVQTVPDGRRLCPDFRAFMSRLSCVHQTFVRSCPEFRVNVQTFMRSPDFRAFNQFSCVHIQAFVRSTDFRAFMSRLSSIPQLYLRSPSFRAFKSRRLSVQQTIVRSCSYFQAFPSFICVHQVFVRSCPDFCAFIKLGCDDPIFVPSNSDMKNLFISKIMGVSIECKSARFWWSYGKEKSINFLCFLTLFVHSKRMKIL